MATQGKAETGYCHVEKAIFDLHGAQSMQDKFTPLPFPFETMNAMPRTENKVWDIHVRFKESDLTQEMKDALLNTGLYYMSRWKTVNGERGIYAVYTIQSITSLEDGETFCKELTDWLVRCGYPKFDVKLETTIFMNRYNNPSVVPPTIDALLRTEN